MKTKTAKHTPGPWTTENSRKPNEGIYIKAHGDYFAQIYDRPDRDGNIEDNARLIAAAPELLEMVKTLIHPKNITFMEAVEKASKLIAKAEGRA